jgi:hypothetical protein
MQHLEANEWTARCAKRLQQQWRSVEPEQLNEVAAQLWRERVWRELPPEMAAVEWLLLGVLVPA